MLLLAAKSKNKKVSNFSEQSKRFMIIENVVMELMYSVEVLIFPWIGKFIDGSSSASSEIKPEKFI